MDSIIKRKKRKREKLDADGKRSLALSIVLYGAALVLPAYNVGLFGGTDIIRGYECLFYISFAPSAVPCSANILLLVTWMFMFFRKKWTLPPAVATLVLALSLLAMDPDLTHYFAGSAMWFMSMAVPIAYGLRQLKKKPELTHQSLAVDYSLMTAAPLEERDQLYVR